MTKTVLMGSGSTGKAVAAVALAAGTLLGLLLAILMRNPDTTIQAALQKYEALSPEERETLHSRQTTVFSDMPAAERQRFEQLHAAISGDTELEEQLERLYAWWIELDPATREELMKLKEASATEWVSSVRSRFHDDLLQRAKDEIIVDLRGRGRSGPFNGDAHDDERIFRFTTARYAEFLDNVAPVDSLDASQAEKLNKLTREGDRLLYRSLWLTNAMSSLFREGYPPRGGQPSDDSERRQPEPRFDTQQAFEQVLEKLVDSGIHEKLTSEMHRQEPERLRRFRQARFVSAFLQAAISHLGDEFNAAHMPEKADLANIFVTLPAQEQQNMMMLDPEDARKRLEEKAIETSSQSGAVINELAGDLNRFQAVMKFLRGGGRGGPPPFGGEAGFGGPRDRSRPDPGEGRRPPRPGEGRDQNPR